MSGAGVRKPLPGACDSAAHPTVTQIRVALSSLARLDAGCLLYLAKSPGCEREVGRHSRMNLKGLPFWAVRLTC